jgi:hypothetical protein
LCYLAAGFVPRVRRHHRDETALLGIGQVSLQSFTQMLASGAMLRQEKSPIGAAPQAVEQPGKLCVIACPVAKHDPAHDAKPCVCEHRPRNLACIRAQKAPAFIADDFAKAGCQGMNRF